MTPDEARIRITVEGEGNRVTALPGGAAARLEVFSARGMGRAAVEFVPDAWPSAVTLRLHLGGLESLRFTFESYIIAVSVPSTMQHTTIESLSNASKGEAIPIAPGNPYWMAVHRTPRTDDPRAAALRRIRAPRALRRRPARFYLHLARLLPLTIARSKCARQSAGHTTKRKRLPRNASHTGARPPQNPAPPTPD